MWWPFGKNTTDTIKDTPRTVSMDDFHDIIQGVMQESRLQAEIDLLRDDIGFDPLGEKSSEPVPEKFRIRTIKDARVHALVNPIARQSVELYANFGVGQGVNYKFVDNDEAETAIDDFFADPRNRKFTSTQGQRELSKSLCTSGNLFFALHTPPNGDIAMRILDTLEIWDVACDIDDRDTPRFYIRRFMRPGKTEMIELVYADWNNTSPMRAGVDRNGKRYTKPSSRTLPVIFQVRFQGLGKFGHSLLTAQLKWLRIHNAFMTSRVAIQQSLARTATWYKSKGGQKAVSALQRQLQSTRAATSSDDQERNPAQPHGSTVATNEAIDIENFKQETGAAAAQIDGAMIMAMAGVAVGVFPHWYGLGESFRLATASAMEIPMVKMFEAYNKLWSDTWQDIFIFILNKKRIDFDLKSLDIDPVEIFPEDVEKAALSLKAVIESVPDLVEAPEVQKRALRVLGINNIDEVIEELNEFLKANPPEDTGIEDEALLEVLNKEAVDIVTQLMQESGKNGASSSL